MRARESTNPIGISAFGIRDRRAEQVVPSFQRPADLPAPGTPPARRANAARPARGLIVRLLRGPPAPLLPRSRSPPQL